MNCTICQSTANHHCTAQVLGKYMVQYYQCSRCQFIFTEPPYWLDEAYSSAITKTDIGLVHRNERMASVTQNVVALWFRSAAQFIDYGGGYGMLVRMMRDRGFDFYRQDAHCPNLFAESFDITDVPSFRAELLTAFEVFEHLTAPVTELENMLQYTDNILFSTFVQPDPNVTPANWWYFGTEHGQHTSLFSRTSLHKLADRFGLHYTWSKPNIHLFSRKPVPGSLFRLITHPRVSAVLNVLVGHPPSLLESDYNRFARQVLPFR